jgi:dienelactone hydrolase
MTVGGDQMRVCGVLAVSLLCLTVSVRAAEPTAGDRMVARYFQQQTEQLQQHCLAEIKTLADWQQRRDEYRRQLLEMLGLDPWPQKTPLQATVTGRVERDDIVVENLHFQSRPQLYVTGNLYLPRIIDRKLPAILYVCGHGGVKIDGVIYGNKVHYQHHGAWFARNGYVCLTIDSLQLGEIEGIHHGTHRYDMWWWLCRGYSPAGVEAWNCLRAVDYLQSRPEVDSERIGVTGRSGGGAYSWWIATIDERIKASVPVAGITDLQNHVVDGCVEGHCDCMFFVNTYGWDYPALPALVAPRPLLISNTDRDSIFPLDGVVRTHAIARRIYHLHDADEKLALNITAGPHKDTQELRVHAFRWLNQHLKNDDELIDTTAVPLFTPQELKVFPGELPSDAINIDIAETFVPQAAPFTPPADAAAWQHRREADLQWLRDRTFRGWPDAAPDPSPRRIAAQAAACGTLETYEFTSQPGIDLNLYVLTPNSPEARRPALSLQVLDEHALWPAFANGVLATVGQHQDPGAKSPENVIRAFVAPRGVGPTALTDDKKHRVQTQRRYYLLGQTEDGMRVWDVRQALRALRAVPACGEAPVTLEAAGPMAGVALYAALFSDRDVRIGELNLKGLPNSHRRGPILLNVQRQLDLPEAVALVAEHTPVTLDLAHPGDWSAVEATRDQLGWPKEQLRILPLPAGNP